MCNLLDYCGCEARDEDAKRYSHEILRISTTWTVPQMRFSGFPAAILAIPWGGSLRDFQSVLCVDVCDCMVDFAIELLESIVRVKEGEWEFGFLCKPLIVCEKRMVRGRLLDYPAGATSDWVVSSPLWYLYVRYREFRILRRKRPTHPSVTAFWR